MTLTPMLFLWLLAAPPPRGCPRAQLDPLPAKVAPLPAVERTQVVSKALAAACEHLLPDGVVDALDSFHATELSEHGPAMLKALREAPDFAKAGCEKWEEEFASHAAPGEKLRSIFHACAFDKAGLATEEELVEVADLGAVYAATPLHRWLTTHGSDAASARRLVRVLLGLSPDAKKKADPPRKGPGKKASP